MTNAIPLPSLAGELRSRYGDAPTYRELYQATLDGRLPADCIKGRWHVRTADLDRVAELFGLTPPLAA